MRPLMAFRFFVIFLLITVAIFPSPLQPQNLGGHLVSEPIDENARVSLPGNVHPLAQAHFDRGPVPDSLPAERALLLLKRSPDKQAALEQFLEAAHTPGDPGYHHWLTPSQFGKIYGPDDSDVSAVRGWLEKHGLKVAGITPGKTAIQFSGSAGQIREAFRTQIHTYEVDGEVHHAIDRDPQVPAALAAVIAGLTPLNDFRPRSYAKVLGRAQYDVSTRVVTPEWTVNSNLVFALAPGDFAMQYGLNPLYQAGTNGAGVTIGIIGASNIDPTVVANYRTLFGLTASPVNVILDGTDPGLNGAMVESYLDVELAGSVAPGATIDLYTAADTTVQSGLFLAAQRAVDEDAAAVLSVSYGVCEQQLGTAGNQFFASLWEQAAAQGQTVLVSSGDGGSAGCDNFDANLAAQYGLAVNGFGSTPWNMSVGGTDFYYSSYGKSQSTQRTELATYWNLSPTPLPSVSLLKAIPEQPWNRAFGLNLFDNGIYNPNNLVTIVAGSGGKSSCTSGTSASDGTIATCSGGYAKPAWQTGSGVPQDSARDLPDVSLFAAPGENDSFYPICMWTGECVSVNGSVSIGGVGGTSASSPAMAGIMALVNQRYGRQGQANFVLYPMAAQFPSVFHDVAIGSNVVPCQQGTPDCTLSALTDNTNAFYTLGHYYAGKGYDQAVGLGSVDANLLVKNWNSLHFASTTTTLTLSQTTFPHGTPVNASVGVTGSGGTPSGDVALTTTATPAVNTGLATMTLANGSAAETLANLPGGQYQVTAHYGGDGTFASSTSTPVTVNVTPEPSALNLSGLYWTCSQCTTGTFQPVVNGASYPYGTYIAADAQPRSANAGAANGIPTGTVTFSDGATSYAASPATINVTRAGVAEWSVAPGFPVANHVLGAAYSGDASYQASKSASSISFSITQGATQIIVPGQPTRFALGTSMPIHVQLGIYPSVVVAPPSGQVTFLLGGQVLGTAPVTPIYGFSWFGEATFNATGLPLGQNLVTIQYPGDNNYTAANSSITISVLQPAGLAASASPNPVNQAATAVVTATVTGVNGVPAPTGFVFMGTPNYSCGGGPDLSATNQTASCSFIASLLDLGTDIVTVSYGGDANYAPQSVAVPLTVTVPFSLAATPVTLSAGATTGNTSTITVTPQGGFTGTALLGCTLTASPTGAKSLPTCSINGVVPMNGANPVTTTMTVLSTAQGTASLAKPALRRSSGLGAGAGAILACVVLFGISARRRRWLSGLAVVVLLAIGGILPGCGGHSANTTGGTTATGTTPGTYTFTVTGGFPGIQPSNQLQTTTVQVTIQ